jgi:sRNA-binding protein
MPQGKGARQRYNRRRTSDDYRRGLKESRTAIETLQTRWPAAFPKRVHLVRPLATGIVELITADTGWSKDYARAVLTVWKSRDGYCKAVLQHERRHDLTGAATDQAVDDVSREQSRQRLVENLAARARRAEKEKQRAADADGKKSTALAESAQAAE